MLMRCRAVTLSEVIEPDHVPVPNMKDGSRSVEYPIPPMMPGVFTSTRPVGTVAKRAHDLRVVRMDDRGMTPPFELGDGLRQLDPMVCGFRRVERQNGVQLFCRQRALPTYFSFFRDEAPGAWWDGKTGRHPPAPAGFAPPSQGPWSARL